MSKTIIPFIYHTLASSYGWTIEYINDMSIAQIIMFLNQIKEAPPTALMGYGFGHKDADESALKTQLNMLGDKVQYKHKHADNPNVQSITRLKDGKRIK